MKKLSHIIIFILIQVIILEIVVYFFIIRNNNVSQQQFSLPEQITKLQENRPTENRVKFLIEIDEIQNELYKRGILKNSVVTTIHEFEIIDIGRKDKLLDKHKEKYEGIIYYSSNEDMNGLLFTLKDFDVMHINVSNNENRMEMSFDDLKAGDRIRIESTYNNLSPTLEYISIVITKVS